MVGGSWSWRAAVAATAVLLSSVVVPAPAPATTPPVRIMLVGDSMTEGSSGDWTWRYRLAKYLDAGGVDYKFVGPRTTMLDLVTNEHTSEEYADPAFDQHHFARWGQSLHAILDENAPTTEDGIGWAVSTYQPDVVVEALGVNDLLYGSSPQETLDVAQRFVDEVRAAKPDTPLVLSTVPDVQYAHVTDYNALLAQTAPTWSTPESPVVVSDPSPGWDPTTDTCDNTHPSAIGEVKIAAAQQDALAGWGIGSPASRPLPEPPVGPRLPAVLSVAPGDGQATLSWQLPPGGTAVLISTRDVTQGDPWRQLPYPVGGTSWLSGGLRNGDTYAYRLNVLKHDCLAADVDSNVATVTPQPAAPGVVSGLVATPGDHRLHASWAQVPSATSYDVWVKPSSSSSGWVTATTTSTAYVVRGLLAGTSYDVAVQATNGGGAGPLSDTASVVAGGLRPVAPTWRSGRARADGSATLSWSPTPGANHYTLSYRQKRHGSPWVTDPQPLTGTSGVVMGLRDATTYLFRVRGVDDALQGSWSTKLVVAVPRVGPVRDVVLRGGSAAMRTHGTAVRYATSYTLLAAGAPGCRRRPAASSFRRVAARLSEPRHRFTPTQAGPALWVRWYAVHDGVRGRSVRSSSACLRR